MQFLSNNNKSRFAFIGLASLTLIFLLMLDDKASPPGTAIVNAEQSNLPDYFMESYNIISVDIEGNANRWLSGKKLEHFPNGDPNLLNPTLQFRQKEQHWLLLAEKGNIYEDKTLSLDGNVNIQQLNGKTKALIIQTEHLDILVGENTASTDQKVKVSDENGEINATGMNINFKEHQLQLLSQVKGHYVFE